jgi:predicted dehydrogenase
MKLALIGAGGIAQAHCAGYRHIPAAQVVAVADLILERAEEKARLFGARAYPSLEALLAAEQPDAVDLCVPSDLHARMAAQCLRAGLHVLCEKPMAFQRREADEVMAAWQESGKFLMIAQVLRFWPEYEYLKKLVDERPFGRLLQVSFSRTSAAPEWGGWYVDPQRSGMAPFELHIHDLDFVYHLLGKPEDLTAYGFRDDGLYASYVRTQLFYPGVVVEAEAGWYHGPVPFKAVYRAVFERAVLDYLPEGLLLYEPGQPEPRKIEVETGPNAGPVINLPGTGPYYNEIAYFVECVEKGQPPAVITPPESREVIELLLRAIEAAGISGPLHR